LSLDHIDVRLRFRQSIEHLHQRGRHRRAQLALLLAHQVAQLLDLARVRPIRERLADLGERIIPIPQPPATDREAALACRRIPAALRTFQPFARRLRPRVSVDVAPRRQP
jgi:hypothetical protein